MAEIAHSTATSDVHALSGSSPPGSAPDPTFTPISGKGSPHSRPRSHPRRDADALSWLDDVGTAFYDRDTHPERHLINACGTAHGVLEDDATAWAAVAEDPSDDAEDETVKAAHQTSAEVRRLSIELSTMSARTPEGLSAKACFLMDALFPSGKTDPIVAASTVSDHVDLLRSILDDAQFIGTRSRFTIAALVGLEKDWPVVSPEEGWRFRHLVQDWADETLDDIAFDEIFERVDLARPKIAPPKELLIKDDDRRLFNLPARGYEIEGFGYVYGSKDQIDALREIYRNDSPGLSFGLNEERRRRAREILDARVVYEGELDKQKQEFGLDENNRASHWRVQNCICLRQRILSTPVSTLDGLLMKAMVFADCVNSEPSAAVAEIEDDLIKDNIIEGATDNVIAKAIVLDLVRILIARGITIRSVAGRPEPKSSSREKAAA